MNRQELLDAIVAAIYENTSGAITGQSLQDTLKEIVNAFTFTDEATAQPAGGMLPGVLYNLGVISTRTTIALAAGVGEVNHYYFTFDIGATLPSITWPALEWAWGAPPSVAENKHYEVSILNGYAIYVESELQA